MAKADPCRVSEEVGVNPPESNDALRLGVTPVDKTPKQIHWGIMLRHCHLGHRYNPTWLMYHIPLDVLVVEARVWAACIRSVAQSGRCILTRSFGLLQ